MTDPSPPFESDTSLAPAARDAPEVVHVRRDAFLADAVGVRVFETMPGPAMVLKTGRQIVTVEAGSASRAALRRGTVFYLSLPWDTAEGRAA